MIVKSILQWRERQSESFGERILQALKGPCGSSTPHSACVFHTRSNRPFAQLWPGDEVRGIAGEIRLRCVCFSLEHSFFFCFGMSFSDHCCVPRFFNRGRASPSLFSHGFERSSELRKYWLLAIRQADWSHFRVPNNTVVCIEHVLSATNFRFHARA